MGGSLAVFGNQPIFSKYSLAIISKIRYSRVVFIPIWYSEVIESCRDIHFSS